MASSSAQARNSGFSQHVARGLRESAIIALGVIAIVLFVALATYSPNDRGFSAATDSVEIHNRIGPVGAWLASIFFFLFGRPAFLFPLMLGAACWVLFRQARSESSRANTAVRIAGFVVVLIASCGLVTLHWLPGDMPASAGGAVGKSIGGGL